MAWVVGGLLLVAAYLLGSIPTGYVIGRLAKGIDIREHGSGNTGATNVFRVVGKGAGMTVLTVDLLKGLLAVRITQNVLTAIVAEATVWITVLPWLITFAGLLAILGHSRSVWLNWTGGKSAATGLGVLLALAWPVGLGTAGVFGLVLGFSRIVSLSSIAAASASALVMVAMQQPIPYILLAIAGSLYVILRHRTNIERLMAGTEPRIGSNHT